MASPQGDSTAVKRSPSRSSVSNEKKVEEDPEKLVVDQDPQTPTSAGKYRPFILGALALLILGWWISATVLRATRHRW
jgi:CNT family concentrative nucleoside transporter